jgi:hypothetical protein
MKNPTLKLIGATAIAVAAFGTIAANSAPSVAPSISTPITQLKFGPTGVKNGTGELYAAAAYGDLSRAAHGTFIKMPAGFVSDVHTHSEDYYGVVISGVGVNVQGTKNDVALPVGSYWLQKGGEPHVTKCISPNECIFFISQPGKFDYVPHQHK